MICYDGFIGVIVYGSMTLMKSGRQAQRFAVAGFEPVGGGQRDGVFGQHAGKAGEHVGEVVGNSVKVTWGRPTRSSWWWM